jgi:hypothetical protein
MQNDFSILRYVGAKDVIIAISRTNDDDFREIEVKNWLNGAVLNPIFIDAHWIWLHADTNLFTQAKLSTINHEKRFTQAVQVNVNFCFGFSV